MLDPNGKFSDIDAYKIIDKELRTILGPPKKEPNAPCRVRISLIDSKEDTSVATLTAALDKIIAAAGPDREVIIWISIGVAPRKAEKEPPKEKKKQ